MKPFNQAAMPWELFEANVDKLFNLCGVILKKGMAKALYEKLGEHDEQHIRAAFNKLVESPPNKLNYASIKAAIKSCIPHDECEKKQVGCEYCDPCGLIQYTKVIGGVSYEYSARCHKCRTSPYINEPFYNEIFPHDDIQPHSTKEQMRPRKQHNTDDVVRLLTNRQSEDERQERQRKRTLYKDEQREVGL